MLELQLFEMNGKQEIVTIDKLILQPSPVQATDVTASEGSGDTATSQDMVSFEFAAHFIPSEIQLVIVNYGNETILSDRE